MFNGVRLLYSRAPLWLSGSFAFVCDVGSALGVCGFIRDCLVDSGAPRETSVSFALVWFIPACPGVCRVYSGAPCVVGFIRVRFAVSRESRGSS